jgi:D-3-phosphoglycerate dehydrogenase
MPRFKILITPQAMFSRRSEVEAAFGPDYTLDFTGAPVHDRAKLHDRLKDADGVVLGVEKIDAETLAAAPKVRVLSRFGTGYDSIDLAAAKECGVRVAATSARLAQAGVARHVIALALAVAHNLKPAGAALASGRWERLANRSAGVFGVLGLGGSGTLAAAAAQALGWRVAYWSRSPKPEAAARGWTACPTPEALLDAADVVSVHMAGGKDLDGFLGAERLARLRGKILVNTARGALVNEEALLRLLDDGTIAGAGLDVFRAEPVKELSARLAAHPRVVATPHVASFDADTVLATSIASAENVRCVLEGRPEKADRLVA